MDGSKTEPESVKVKLVETKLDDGIRNECRQLCAEYLAGPWIDLKADEIEVQIIEGGLSNSIYCCTNLKLFGKGNSKFPEKVLLRKYGSDFVGERGDMILIPDAAIPVLSEILHYKGLGPKIYGIFEKGRIEEFIENRKFTREEWKDDKILQVVMKKMADIHLLDMPISKNPEALLNLTTLCYEKGLQNEFLFSDKVDPSNKPIVDTMLELDILSELAWIREMIPLIRSPVVFCHNDLHFGNIFERLDRKTFEERLFIIDYENCCYGYRGYDLAFFLRLKRVLPSDLDSWNDEYYPESGEKRHLLKAYLERYIEIHGDNIDPEIDNLDHLELEADFFSVVMDCVWNAVSRSKINEDNQFVFCSIQDKPSSIKDLRAKVRGQCELLKQKSHRLEV